MALAALLPLITAIIGAAKGPGAPAAPAAGGEAGIDIKPTIGEEEKPIGSKMNQEIAVADGQPPPSIAAPPPQVAPGTGPLPASPLVDLGQSPTPVGQTSPGGFRGDPTLPESAPIDTGGGGEKMSMEAKMAIAAQMGSLLRGPGAPRPPSAPSGPGINMQPTTIADLYGRR